ncbi:MAG: DUF4336 domain-containing protein [Proteobacteria bacterium]|nr:DUF4336 domain-containing protein [Pseudomonadota bacterium]
MDRLLIRARPSPVPDYRPPPQEIEPGLWVLDRQLRHFGMARLPSRTTLVLLGDHSLAVISPPALLDPASLAAIEAIGRVAYIVVPNSFHYLYTAEFARHFPTASILTAPGLGQRVPEWATHLELEAGRPPDSWSGVLRYEVLGPVNGVSEVLFFHVPTATLVLTDLAFNMERYPRAVDRLFWRFSGIPSGFGPGRTTRSLMLRDRAAAVRALSNALAWPIEQIVVAHGDVVCDQAHSRLRAAFRSSLGELPAP